MRQIPCSEHHLLSDVPCATKAARMATIKAGLGSVGGSIGVFDFIIEVYDFNMLTCQYRMSESVRAYIERMKAALRVKTDEELGKRLGYSKQAIANWRRRGRVPAETERELVDAFGVGFAVDQWLKHYSSRREDETVYASTLYAFERFIRSLEVAPTIELRRSLGYIFPEIEFAIRLN